MSFRCATRKVEGHGRGKVILPCWCLSADACIYSFGPDPYLNGEASYETIVGVQSTGVQACVKHLLGNTQEHWRYGYSSNIDDRTMHEIYFYPFLRSIEVIVSRLSIAENCAYFWTRPMSLPLCARTIASMERPPAAILVCWEKMAS